MRPQDELLDVVDLAYQAALAPELWPEVLGRASRLAGAESAALLWRGRRDRPDGGLTAHLDPDAVAVYFSRYIAINPIQRGLDRAWAAAPRTGVVLTDADCVERGSLERSETFNDFMRPFHMEHVLLVGAPSHVGPTTLNLFRGRRAGGFGEQEVQVGWQLNRPLANAFEMAARLGLERGVVGELAEFVSRLPGAVLIVGPDARIVFANAAAEAMLAQRDGVCADRGRFRACGNDAQARLARLLGLATAAESERRQGGTLALPRPSGRRPLALLAAPARGERRALGLPWPLALVSIIDPESEPRSVDERLRALFGFTRAEARVAARLAMGEDQAEIADALGLSLNTVRVQVARIRAKTDTRRQGEFISLVLRSLGADWA